jgi:hypothetical protein
MRASLLDQVKNALQYRAVPIPGGCSNALSEPHSSIGAKRDNLGFCAAKINAYFKKCFGRCLWIAIHKNNLSVCFPLDKKKQIAKINTSWSVCLGVHTILNLILQGDRL